MINRHLPLTVSCMMIAATSIVHADAAPNRISVWDGAKAAPSTWVTPTSSTFQPESSDTPHSGHPALELTFDATKAWIGAGYDWFNWKAGRDVGTDTSGMTSLTLWVKSKSNATDLQLQLLCNGDVIDTPEHHTAKVDVLKYCPSLLDGKWHEVVIPLADLTQSQGYDPKVVTMIDFGFWTDTEAKGSFLIDDIAFTR